MALLAPMALIPWGHRRWLRGLTVRDWIPWHCRKQHAPSPMVSWLSEVMPMPIQAMTLAVTRSRRLPQLRLHPMVWMPISWLRLPTS